mmetsp:Transcript_40117/g.92171  ORF Transcript_40117/g.92171 Transcript_40117/m.92171 type:complete len:350 (+) Transcript_40117:61-1110(+)
MAPPSRSVDTFERIFGSPRQSAGDCPTDSSPELLPSARSPRPAWGEVTVAELLDRSASPPQGSRGVASSSRERHYCHRTPTPAMPPGGKDTIGSMIRIEDRKTLPASSNPQLRPIFRPVRRQGACRPSDSDVDTIIETDAGKGRRKYASAPGSRLRPADWELRSCSNRGLGRRQSPEATAAARSNTESKPVIAAEITPNGEDPLVQTIGVPGSFQKIVSVGSRRRLTQESSISFEQDGGDERPTASTSPCPTGRSLNASSSTSSSMFFQRRTGLDPPVRSWSPVTRGRPTWIKDDRVGRPAPPPHADASATMDGSIELCDQLSLSAFRFHQRELNYSWNMHSARTRWRR